MVAFSSLVAFGVSGAAALQAGPLALQGSSRGAVVTMQTGGSIKEVGDMSMSPEAGNYGRLSDKLKAADLERRMEEEAVQMREEAMQRALPHPGVPGSDARRDPEE